MLLEVKNLVTSFKTPWGRFRAVDEISFSLNDSECLALVGESGCGKSVTALSIMRLIQDPPGLIESGELLLKGQDLLKLPESKMRKVRGGEISMIFQEPMTSLNPVFSIGNQIDEAILLHTNLSRSKARKKTLEMMELVGIPDVKERAEFYPHQLSGGLRQRVMIAMALACEPAILIADEPTTALDVSIQAQILDLLRGLQKKMGMSLLMITHDFGVVAEIADRVAVMYGGKIVESASVTDIFDYPKHPYTRALQRSIPEIKKRGQPLYSIPFSVPDAEELIKGADLESRWKQLRDLEESKAESPNSPTVEKASSDPAKKDLNTEVFVELKDLKVHFHIKKSIFGRPLQTVRAVDGVSFKVNKGETLGLVGESGCGKSTLGRSILRLLPVESGGIFVEGKDVSRLRHRDFKAYRRRLQMVFQDPFSSLNPRMRVKDIIEEPLILHSNLKSIDRLARVRELLHTVGLARSSIDKFPHEFSGGQRQRISIARALAVKPSFLVADEPVSALDVSIQAQILNLLQDLKSEFGLTYLFISHDLNVIGYLCDRVIVMKDGKIVEEIKPHDLLTSDTPLEDYTRKLLNSIPRRHPNQKRV
ncbi:MAG: ABC transporter ATP-binding protein [Bradymonadales bacterium]|nr:MAG: ABC transporter ATP-binding protein [Bradymonadales bacterium]